jgi:cytochrome c oxidase subunit 2
MSGLLPAASANGPSVDRVLAALLGVSCAVLLLVFGLMLVYVVRYRAASTIDRGRLTDKSWRFEIAWTSATLVVFFGLFIWGADLYVQLYHSSPAALKIYVVGKQWMWKVEHPTGQREINALHLPVGKPVDLIMTSEDVIHDFSVPAFRIKHDVLPGRYETLSFEPTRVGTYDLYCTQFCGLDHAAMTGKVVVLSQSDYAAWLAAQGPTDDLAHQGQALFVRYGCDGCHGGRGTVHAPNLARLYGSPVPLADGRVVVADERYLRDSILQPGREIAAGYAPVMPSFAGQIDESSLLELIAYLKSLSQQAGGVR